MTLDVEKAAVTCHLCKQRFIFSSCVANMIAPDFNTFFRYEDKIATQVAQGLRAGDFENVPFRNMALDARGKTITVRQVCYLCAGERIQNNRN